MKQKKNTSCASPADAPTYTERGSLASRTDGMYEVSKARWYGAGFCYAVEDSRFLSKITRFRLGARPRNGPIFCSRSTACDSINRCSTPGLPILTKPFWGVRSCVLSELGHTKVRWLWALSITRFRWRSGSSFNFRYHLVFGVRHCRFSLPEYDFSAGLSYL